MLFIKSPVFPNEKRMNIYQVLASCRNCVLDFLHILFSQRVHTHTHTSTQCPSQFTHEETEAPPFYMGELGLRPVHVITEGSLINLLLQHDLVRGYGILFTGLLRGEVKFYSWKCFKTIKYHKYF